MADNTPADFIIIVSVLLSVFFGWRLHLAVELPLLRDVRRPRRPQAVEMLPDEKVIVLARRKPVKAAA
jgi:peptidoglycan/LPS O-acetylase OafA/YrhL